MNAKTNRIIANVGLMLTPFSWGNINTNIGADSYTNQNQILRHPESSLGFVANGILDQADDITRSINTHTLLNINNHAITQSLSVTGFIGQSISDYKSTTDGLLGQNFLDPNFISVNNALLRSSRTVISQRRLLSLFGSATIDLNRYLYLTVTGRNDWTSTIPGAEKLFLLPVDLDELHLLGRVPFDRQLHDGQAEGGVTPRSARMPGRTRTTPSSRPSSHRTVVTGTRSGRRIRI